MGRIVVTASDCHCQRPTVPNSGPGRMSSHMKPLPEWLHMRGPRGLRPVRVLRVLHLTNKARRRTVVMDYADAAHLPAMQAAIMGPSSAMMAVEIASFKRMAHPGCV